MLLKITISRPIQTFSVSNDVFIKFVFRVILVRRMNTFNTVLSFKTCRKLIQLSLWICVCGRMAFDKHYPKTLDTCVFVKSYFHRKQKNVRIINAHTLYAYCLGSFWWHSTIQREPRKRALKNFHFLAMQTRRSSQ